MNHLFRPDAMPRPVQIHRRPRVVGWALLVLLFVTLAPATPAQSGQAHSKQAQSKQAQSKQARSGQTAEPPTVTGHLLDAGGRAVRNARITLLPWSTPYEQARLELDKDLDPPVAVRVETDGDGLFELRAPAAGLWRLRIEAAGFVPVEHPLLPLLHDLDLPTLRLTPAVPRRVQVLDTEGQPISGSRVVLQNSAPRQGWTPALRSGWTGRGGRVRLPAGTDENLHLALWAPGFEERLIADDRSSLSDTSVSDTSVNGAALDRGTLRSAVPRGIRVHDPQDQPVQNAVVKIGHGQWPAGVTDARGYLRVFIRAEGQTPVLVEDAEGRRAQAMLRPAPRDVGREQPRVLRLKPPTTVAGRILDPEGRPIAGALVWPGALPALYSRSDAQGRYRLDIPQPASGSDFSTTVWAAALGYRTQATLLAADPLDVRLSPSWAASGIVVDEAGTAIPNATLRAFGSLSVPENLVTRSRPDGTFQFSTLAVGKSYEILAWAPSYARAVANLPGESDTSQQAPAPLRLVLRRGHSATGSVMDSEGIPIAGAQVRLQPVDAKISLPSRYMSSHSTELRTVTGEAGQYHFRHLAAADYDLVAQAQGFASTRVRGIELSSDQELHDLGVIVLEPGVTLFGRIVDEQERPLTGASVTARVAESFLPEDELDTRTTDEDGRFHFADLRAGERLDVQVERDGYLGEIVNGIELPLEATVEITLRRAYSLAGRLLNTDGSAMPDATVMLAPLEGRLMFGRHPVGLPTRHDTADETTGDFVVDELVPGRYRLYANAPGYMELEREIDIVHDESSDYLELRLERGATLVGIVRDASGRPLNDILIRTLGTGGPPSPVHNLSQQRTAADGSYQLTGLTPGRHQIAAQHDAFLRVVREVDIAARGQHRLDFELQPGANVSGWVIDEAGAAVSGTQLNLMSETQRKISYSATDGSFEFAGLEDGVFLLQGQHSDYASTTSKQTLTIRDGRSVEDVTLVLERGGSVRGQIYGLDFDQLSRTSVWASGPGGTAGGSVDFEGKFHIEALAEGTWRIIASVLNDQRYASATIELANGEHGHVDVEFTDGYIVAGRVTLEGEPVSGASIRLLGDSDLFSGGTAVTDYQGRFQIEQVEAGSYHLSVQRTNRALNYSEGVDVFGSLDLDIRIPNQKLRGRVVDAQDGSPIPRVLLRATPIGGRPSSLTPSTHSASDGTFELARLSPGPWRLQAEKDGFASAALEVQVDPDRVTEGIELRLEPPAGLRLQISRANGQPAAYADVALLDLQGNLISSASRSTAEAGRFHLDAAPPGTWLVVVTSYLSSTTVTVTTPGPEVAVRLPASAGLDVRLTGGRERQGLLQLRNANGALFRTASMVGVQGRWPLRAGHLLLQGIPVGTWTLEVTLGDGSQVTRTVELNAGQLLEVEIP